MPSYQSQYQINSFYYAVGKEQITCPVILLK